MSSTEASSFDPSSAPPAGAIPQALAAGLNRRDPDDPLRAEARSGDTDVVFRLERRLPFLAHLADTLDRLADYWRILIAGAVVVVSVVALALILGGAYRKPPSHHEIPAPVAAVAPPVPAPTPIVSAPEVAPVAAATVVTEAPAAPAVPRATHRTGHAKKHRPRARH